MIPVWLKTAASARKTSVPVEPPAETRNGELAVPANLLASEWIAVRILTDAYPQRAPGLEVEGASG